MDRVSDAYLKKWTAEELTMIIQMEHPDAGPDLRVWSKGAEVTGPFEWDDISLCVAERSPKEDEYPDLWRWEITDGDQIRITTAGGGGMFPGGLVGWQEGPEPMEWITILEAQVRLGQRHQARQDRLIMITRNGRTWDGGPPNMFDVFRIIAQGWGGAPKRKTTVLTPRPPPPPIRRTQKKILIERCGYSQVFMIDAGRPVQMITLQIAEEARIPNPSAWIMSSLVEEIIRDSKDIVEG
jgi:hypothetical protein